IGSLDALGGQCIENSVGVRWYWSVVESNHHFMIFQRQRLCVLHAADALEISRADCKNAASAQCIRVASARLPSGCRRSYQTKNQKSHSTTHQALTSHRPLEAPDSIRRH